MRIPLSVTAATVVFVLGAGGMVQGAVILVDNHDPEVTYTGTWPTSTWSSDRIGPNYQHSNRVTGLTATYTPTCPMPGSTSSKRSGTAAPNAAAT